MQLLRSHFRPEFLNRIDEIIVFRALNKEQVIQIAELLLDRVRRRRAAGDRPDIHAGRRRPSLPIAATTPSSGLARSSGRSSGSWRTRCHGCCSTGSPGG